MVVYRLIELADRICLARALMWRQQLEAEASGGSPLLAAFCANNPCCDVVLTRVLGCCAMLQRAAALAARSAVRALYRAL